MVTNYILYLVVDEHGKNPNRKCHTSFLILGSTPPAKEIK
jgi:hypothetical protein